MAILVTGGAGYIGSHTCLELLEAGYEVVVVDNLHNSSREALQRVQDLTNKSITFYQNDVLNMEALSIIFKLHDIEAVIHFAGMKAVAESAEKPLDYYMNNVAGLLVLCEVMSQYHVRKLVFSSSATVYGVPQKCPITENEPLRATNPYGRTKLMSEQILYDLYVSDSRWSIALLRYFNPIGAHQSGRIGEDPTSIPNNLAPYITQVAIGRLQQLTIYGNDYDTPDGTEIRDYIHVVDLAKGHLKALNYVSHFNGLEAFNIGTGRGYSVLEVVAAFEKASGKKIPYVVANRRAGDVAVSFADVTKARVMLGWSAQLGIAEMCQDAWRWQLFNPNGYRTAKEHLHT